MISVMNSDCEFDRNSDGKVGEIEPKPRVSGGTIIGSSNDEENLMDSEVAYENRVSPMELGPVTSESETCEEAKLRVRVSPGSDNDMESGFFQVEKEKEGANQIDSGGNDHFEVPNDEFNGRNDSIEADNDQTVSSVPPRVDRHVEVYKSLLSEFDDFVANEKMNVGTSRALSYGFEVGDMVWGKVKSHPWWPGHIFNEACASSSVHRTRRDGYVLVAFFGDSSYGWFDPADLIPFDPHFMEKSQQTNSRTFVKAVEEAIDEAGRRRGLGLACKCRNLYNFRPTNVQGYLTVDVPDFEPGGFYSANQINKARDGFEPAETVNFVRQLASGPHCCDQMSLVFFNNKATVFAFRKAVFEEFDETYAQAFGVQPARPSHDRTGYQLARQARKAPLSGPLVIAEALGGGKSSKKPMKIKDHSKKDRFLFKRRNEAGDSRAPPISQGQTGSLSPSAVMEGSSAVGAGDYVLQKRAPAPQTTVKFEHTDYISRECAGSGGDLSEKEAVTADEASAYSSTANHSSAWDARSSPDVVLDSSESEMLGKGAFPGLTDGIPLSSQGKAEVMVDIKIEESAKISRSSEGLQHLESSFSAREGGHRLDQVQDSSMGAHSLPIDLKRSVKKSLDGKMKKTKIIKRPLGDLSTEKLTTGEPKKKKKKKEFGTEPNSDHQQKHLGPRKGEVAVGNLTKNSAQAGLAPREDLRINNQKKDGGVSTFALNSVGTSAEVGMGNIEVELPQLLRDLHALALDPFHGVERNCPAIIQQCFLRFRSLVYQKSLVLSSPSETESLEVNATKSSSVSGENVRDLQISKPVKHLGRPDNPTKAGRKRLLSDRQEEIAAKRLKKINQFKSLTAEKKSSQRALDGQRVEGKERATVPPPNLFRQNPVKKLEPSSKAVEPTMLVMKFPPETSLPSAAELKARFGRFRSIDQSAIRVFWKSSTCRVVFRHKTDAQAAYRYANGNNMLFGNVKVRYIIREVEAPAPKLPDFDKVRGDDPSNETSRIKDPMVVDRPIPIPAPGSLSQQMIQLKSCLKKPASDEAGQVIGGTGSKGTARVTFMLGGEESNRGEQMMVGNRNNFNSNNNTSFADGGASSASTSVGMDFNSKNFHKVIPPSFSSSPSILPHSQFGKPLYNNTHHLTEVSPRNSHNVNTPAILPPQPPSIDISQQMLSLLTKCNDIVTNVTGLLGYVPYHPL